MNLLFFLFISFCFVLCIMNLFLCFFLVSFFQVFEGVEVVDLECIGSGNPYPTYKWYKGLDFENITEVTSALDNRYTLTGGKFTIEGAEGLKDLATYHCKVENEIGSVLSNQAQLLFGCKYIHVNQTMHNIVYLHTYIVFSWDV